MQMGGHEGVIFFLHAKRCFCKHLSVGLVVVRLWRPASCRGACRQPGMGAAGRHRRGRGQPDRFPGRAVLVVLVVVAVAIKGLRGGRARWPHAGQWRGRREDGTTEGDEAAPVPGRRVGPRRLARRARLLRRWFEVGHALGKMQIDHR